MFYLESDTAYTIAQEMVEALDMLHEEDIAVIAELIDDLIARFDPTWKPTSRKSSYSGGMSSSEGSVIIQNDQIALGSVKVPEQEKHGCKGSENSSIACSGDWMKSSNDSYNTIMSFNEDGEKDVFEDLKKELELIEALYSQRMSDIQKSREAAIEDAKRRWVSKKSGQGFDLV